MSADHVVHSREELVAAIRAMSADHVVHSRKELAAASRAPGKMGVA